MDGTKEAFVIKIGDRFYTSHNKNLISTAWSLAGATLFLEGTFNKISDVEDHLKMKGHKPVRKIVRLID